MDNQILQYHRLAYCVIRDAVAFYFGIPVFLESNKDLDAVIPQLIEVRLRKTNNFEKAEQAVKAFVEQRVTQLEEDYKHCHELLANDNIWYQLLGIDHEVFFKYLESLSDSEKLELAVVPRWTTEDASLGRPYINDNFTLINEGTNAFA